jgi:hypothetical protein
MGARGLRDDWKIFLKNNPGFAKNKNFKNTFEQMARFEKACSYWLKAEVQASKYMPVAAESWAKSLAAMNAFSNTLQGTEKSNFEAFVKQCEAMDPVFKKAFEGRKSYDPVANAARARSGADAAA